MNCNIFFLGTLPSLSRTLLSLWCNSISCSLMMPPLDLKGCLYNIHSSEKQKNWTNISYLFPQFSSAYKTTDVYHTRQFYSLCLLCTYVYFYFILHFQVLGRYFMLYIIFIYYRAMHQTYVRWFLFLT